MLSKQQVCMFFLPQVSYGESSFSTWHNKRFYPHSALTAVLYYIFYIHYTQYSIQSFNE